MELHDGQAGYLESTKPEVFLYAGRGYGKTLVEGIDTYDCAAIGGTIQLLCAPTLDQLRNSTLKNIQKAWHKIGYAEGEHYVVNEKPKEEWDIPAFSSLGSHRIISWINGSFIVADSLENFDKHRGSEYDRITVDEFQNINPDCRTVLLGCRRGNRMQELGLPIQIKYGLTPPKDASSFLIFKKIVEQLEGTDSADFFRGTSFDNKDHLPGDYISTLQAGLSPKDVQREVYGELVRDEAGNYVYSFDEDRHIMGLAVQERDTLHLWIDFNLNVMATTVWQFSDNHCYCVDEFAPEKGMDILKRCDTIKARYGKLLRGCIVTGDPAKGQTGHKANMNFYTQMQAELGLDDEQFHVKKSHPDGRDAQTLVNSMFSRFPDLKIHPRCTNLIHDIQSCVTDENGKLDKKTDKTLTHYLDTMIYGFDYNFKGWYLNK